MPQIKTFKSSPFKAAAAVAVCAAFSFAGFFIVPDRPFLGWATVLLFGGVVLVGLAGILTGGTSLLLAPKGFEISSLFKRTRIRWDEIEPLQLAKIKASTVIAVNYLPGSPKRGLSRSLTGLDVAIGNNYRVPLHELCDTMNELRAQYVDARRPMQAAAPQASGSGQPLASSSVDAEPTGGKPPRPFLIALGAALLVLVLNIVLRIMVKLEGMPVTIGIAFGVGGLVAMWFLKVVKRPPTPQERTTFLWLYSALIILPYLGMFALGSATRGVFNGSALLVLALHSLAYPAAAQMFLSEKRLKIIQAKKR